MSGPVHVVGAGFAGAAAAVTLADAGVPVVLWEAGRAPGGRAGGFTDRATGEDLDTGPHLFLGAYHRTRALLERLGTGDRLAFQPRLRVPLWVDGRSGGLALPHLPGPLGTIAGLATLRPLGLRDRLRLLKGAHALRRVPPGGESVAAWLARIGMPAAAVRLLWDPLCRAVMNLPPADADAAPFAAALRAALLGSREDARLGWARDGLSALLGPALGKHLAARGGELRPGRVARLLRDGREAVTGLALGRGVQVPAGRVVLAVDAFAARRLLADGAASAVQDALAAMRPAPIVSCYLWLDRPCVPSVPGAPFLGLVGLAAPEGAAPAAEWVFDRGADADGGQRVATVASAAFALADLKAEAVASRALADLSVHFPSVQEATVRRFRVVKQRRATVCLTPGLRRPAPGPVQDAPGLFLCGDYTDTGLPATIEGAVQSGEAAARAVLAA